MNTRSQICTASLTLILSLASWSGCVVDTAVDDAQTPAAYSDIQDAKRQFASQVAEMLSDGDFRHNLQWHLMRSEDGVMLDELMSVAKADDGRGQKVAETATQRLEQMQEQMQKIDQYIREAKHIEDYTTSLLEVRLVLPGTDGDTRRAATARDNFAWDSIDWDRIPVAFTPAGDESEWSDIEAFDSSGRVILLDPYVQPAFPVLVAGINGREAARAGVAYINHELAMRGLRTAAPAPYAAPDGAPSGGRFKSASTETSKLDYIRVNDDQEPWMLGRAEMYALVSGVHFDRDAVQLEAVDMPYLDYEDTDYTPNQILIFWETYRFAAANVQLFEHDDNTNYQTLVIALISAVEQVLNLTAPEYAIIARIANEIVRVMPDSWFSNDDDYVDSFYTLEKNRTYISYRGAARNATITLRPYTLQGN